MPLKRPSPLVACVVASVLMRAGLASAEPSKEECVAANERAQTLRQRGSLEASREELVTCLAATCPEPVRLDCADRLVEIGRATPTFVFHATDPAGRELTDVRLRIDGAMVVEHVEDHPVAVDPGSHRLSFSSPSGYALDESVVAREGEKERPERVVLRPVQSLPVQRIAGISAMGVGGAGLVTGTVLGIVAKLTYDGALRDDCGGDAQRCDRTGVSGVSAAHAQATGATVALVSGAVVGVGGVVLWATSRSDVRFSPSLGGGSLGFRGTF